MGGNDRNAQRLIRDIVFFSPNNFCCKICLKRRLFFRCFQARAKTRTSWNVDIP